MKKPESIVLLGDHVVLNPLRIEHAEDLFAAFAEDPTIFRWLPWAPPSSLEAMRALVTASLEAERAGAIIAFAQTDPASGRAAGMTSYLDIRASDGGLEIGATWIGKRFQRTALNTEAKYLLLRHAFDDLGAVRVQLKTDARNEQSQTAIARIGGIREGVLRKHKILHDGFVRDTVMFSIVASEWPRVKAALEAKLTGRA
jgi:RimJ/RimL family protein N-acetyltransferase